MRITITDKEYQDFKDLYMDVDIDWGGRTNKVILALLEKMLFEKTKETSSAKTNAAKKATKKRSDNAKAKIENAVNLLRMLGSAITTYTVSVESGCSFNTCKKYEQYWKNKG